MSVSKEAAATFSSTSSSTTTSLHKRIEEGPHKLRSLLELAAAVGLEPISGMGLFIWQNKMKNWIGITE